MFVLYKTETLLKWAVENISLSQEHKKFNKVDTYKQLWFESNDLKINLAQVMTHAVHLGKCHVIGQFSIYKKLSADRNRTQQNSS